jgi:hypothetical protein
VGGVTRRSLGIPGTALDGNEVSTSGKMSKAVLAEVIGLRAVHHGDLRLGFRGDVVEHHGGVADRFASLVGDAAVDDGLRMEAEKDVLGIDAGANDDASEKTAVLVEAFANVAGRGDVDPIFAGSSAFEAKTAVGFGNDNQFVAGNLCGNGGVRDGIAGGGIHNRACDGRRIGANWRRRLGSALTLGKSTSGSGEERDEEKEARGHSGGSV